jgi:hypothetical protein
VNPLWAYFWPSFVAGIIVGVIALTLVFRRRPTGWRKWLILDGAVGIAALCSLLWSGPLGGARRFIDSVEPLCLAPAPLTRQLILEGPADDFQTSELVRLMSQLPGVSDATWKGGNGALPIILEGALVAIAGLLVGALLAYLAELHRRHNAQWSW